MSKTSSRFGNLLTRDIVPLKDAGRVRQTDYEVNKIRLSEQKNAQELRRMEAEVHVESIRASLAEIGIETESNNYYKAEIERDTSEVNVDIALGRRDLAEILLEQTENELDYIENRTELLLQKWGEELRSLSIEVDIKEFDNNNRETIALELGVPVTQYRFEGTRTKAKGLAGLFGGNK